jgi:flagellar biosynthesis protein
MISHHWRQADPFGSRPPEVGLSVTQKPGPDRSLAIALENVTPEALARAGAGAGDRSGAGAGGAPRVVASGRGAVAEQILQIAFERGVKVRTDSDLAEILAAVEVDSEIPLAALAGVAEILRYLYRTDAGAGAGAAGAAGGPQNATPGAGPDRDEE